MENHKQMPITVAREMFVKNITELVNHCGLHPIIIEPILKDLLAEIRDINQSQLEHDKEEWLKEQRDEDKD